MRLEDYSAEIENHRNWLASFGNNRLMEWERRFAADPEAAVVEACTREFLQEHVAEVKPAEDPTSGGPDFCCVQASHHFYVETTCMKEDAVTQATGLSPLPKGAFDFGPLTQKVLDECRNKARQCSGLDAPCLLAIGILHPAASTICFNRDFVPEVLTGDTMITMRFDAKRGQAVGKPYQTTDLHNAAFLRPLTRSDDDLDHLARRSISGLLLCGFGCNPYNVNGVLHPKSVRPFDRALLPDVPFCTLGHGYTEGKFKWV
ncbi:MAG: hypothetical protein WBD63_04305 [Phycisphaerae bacterium]|nr:hypothetical protein [Phycisphaerae bacterium]